MEPIFRQFCHRCGIDLPRGSVNDLDCVRHAEKALAECERLRKVSDVYFDKLDKLSILLCGKPYGG